MHYFLKSKVLGSLGYLRVFLLEILQSLPSLLFQTFPKAESRADENVPGLLAHLHQAVDIGLDPQLQLLLQEIVIRAVDINVHGAGEGIGNHPGMLLEVK